ncbi:mitochondrial dynamics protein MID49-like [Diadema setosum]|uniref:mitochondrial dynamics protein MID49-like n=1 Tax=Diadema setosum TaxID=31175 RepID=UPI003B3AED9E
MAGRNRQSQEQSRESWWSLGLKGAAGIGVLSASALIAAEAYRAAKQTQQRQYQQQSKQKASTSGADGESGEGEVEETTENQEAVMSRPCDWSDYEEVDSDDYEEAAAQVNAQNRSGGDGGSSQESQNNGEPLLRRLNSYYSAYVVPNEERQQTQRDELQNFLTFFMKYVRQHEKSLHLGSAFFAADRSHVTIVKAYDSATKLMVVPIEMDPNTWECVDAQHSVMKAPGYFLVKRINLDFIPKGQDPSDRFMVGNYFCPAYVLRHLQKLLADSIEQYSEEFNEERPSLTIQAKIYAKVGQESIALISSPYCPRTSVGTEDSCESDRDEDHEVTVGPDANLWMWSYNEYVLEMLHHLDGGEGCRMQCLAIMEALRVNNSKLQVLSHAHLLAIMYIACKEETDWGEQVLAERFLDVLVILTNCLADRNLPHPQEETVNCFIDLPSWALQRTHKWLQAILKNTRKISKILKHKY